METKRSIGSEFFKSIFGSISGGLSVFSNNPFRRKDEGNVSASPGGRGNIDVRSKEQDIASMGSTLAEEKFKNMEKGELHRGKLIKRYPELEFERSRKKYKATNKEKSTVGVEADPPCFKRVEDGELRKTTKKKKTENLIGEPPPAKRINLEEQGFEHQPGSPHGSDGTSLSRSVQTETRSQYEVDPIAPQKRQKVNIPGGLQERETKGAADSCLFANGSGMKSDLARSVTKRKRENEIEDRYEKRIRSSDSLTTIEKNPENFYEEKTVEINDGKTQARAHQIAPKNRQKGGLYKCETKGGADLWLFTNSSGTKSDLARSVTKRKRENAIEDRYEKRIRGSDSPPTTERHTENFYEKKRDELNDGKTQGRAQDLSSRKRKRIDDNPDAMNSKPFDDDDKLKRTIFVGNLSLRVKKKAIIKEFSQYGAVESVRLRSVPLLDTKIPRKGAIIKGKINDAVDSQHAYIVFKQDTSANAALAHNMKLFNGNHIRVDAAHAPSGVSSRKAPLSYDRTRSIFVGNVPFDVKDEELYQIFSSGQGTEVDVEAIRVVRDPQTSLSKGIAFVLFKTKAGATRVLSSKRGLKLRDRVLRVSRVVATQIEQKQLSPRKRWMTSEIEEGALQKKRTKLSASYEGTRATKDGKSAKRTPQKLSKKIKIKVSKTNSGYPGTSQPNPRRQAAASGKGLNEITGKLSGFKRKRVEKSQRGISRSKKIRRS